MFRILALVIVALLACVDSALAEGIVEEQAAGGLSLDGLAAGLCIGLAAFGGALGQAKAATAALEGIGRNPGASGQMFTPMILGLVLIESLVIYALVVALKLVGLF